MPAKKKFKSHAENGCGLGGIVGAVRFKTSNKTSKSVWYNRGADYAWIVDKHVCFQKIFRIQVKDIKVNLDTSTVIQK